LLKVFNKLKAALGLLFRCWGVYPIQNMRFKIMVFLNIGMVKLPYPLHTNPDHHLL